MIEWWPIKIDHYICSPTHLQKNISFRLKPEKKRNKNISVNLNFSFDFFGACVFELDINFFSFSVRWQILYHHHYLFSSRNHYFIFILNFFYDSLLLFGFDKSNGRVNFKFVDYCLACSIFIFTHFNYWRIFNSDMHFEAFHINKIRTNWNRTLFAFDSWRKRINSALWISVLLKNCVFFFSVFVCFCMCELSKLWMQQQTAQTIHLHLRVRRCKTSAASSELNENMK